jgi:molybdopterin-guanine dinucleotide biosynthesis protein A
MKRYRQVAAFVLAGGVSSRMGREKGLLEFGGEPLNVRTVRLVEPLVSEVIVVGAPERYSSLGLHAIVDRDFRSGGDREAVRSPLVGIASALTASTATWNQILACDLPYLTPERINWLLGRAVDSEAQVVMPRTPRGVEPLAAVYRVECAAPIVAALGRGIRKVTDAMAELRIEFVLEAEWGRHDPDGRVLKNMNTPAEYEAAKKWGETK